MPGASDVFRGNSREGARRGIRKREACRSSCQSEPQIQLVYNCTEQPGGGNSPPRRVEVRRPTIRIEQTREGPRVPRTGTFVRLAVRGMRPCTAIRPCALCRFDQLRSENWVSRSDRHLFTPSCSGTFQWARVSLPVFLAGAGGFSAPRGVAPPVDPMVSERFVGSWDSDAQWLVLPAFAPRISKN